MRRFTETAATVEERTGMLIGFLLKGMLVGVVIAVPVGPVGILCIRRTILDGRLAGTVFRARRGVGRLACSGSSPVSA
jgi:hypothetical protein